jgi:hypothetical protein
LWKLREVWDELRFGQAKVNSSKKESQGEELRSYELSHRREHTRKMRLLAVDF